MAGYFVLVITSILCGFAAADCAKKQGRHQGVWFLIGAALNVFAFVVIAAMPRVKKVVN